MRFFALSLVSVLLLGCAEEVDLTGTYEIESGGCGDVLLEDALGGPVAGELVTVVAIEDGYALTLPDAFGLSAALPCIDRECALDGKSFELWNLVQSEGRPEDRIELTWNDDEFGLCSVKMFET
jgi:hypothetical protein